MWEGTSAALSLDPPPLAQRRQCRQRSLNVDAEGYALAQKEDTAAIFGLCLVCALFLNFLRGGGGGGVARGRPQALRWLAPRSGTQVL